MQINTRWMRNASIMSSAVTLQGILIYVGYRLGTFLDGKFGTNPYLMFVCLIAGFALGLWWITYMANRVNRQL